MTLLICTFAAIIFTVEWYKHANDRSLMLHVPSFIFWGASLMWMIDAWFGYKEDGAEFFAPAAADMLNDAYLGLAVVALGMILWLVILLIKDPKGVVKSAILRKK